MRIIASLFAGVIIGYVLRTIHECWASSDANKIKKAPPEYPYWSSLSKAMEEANQIMKWVR